MLLGGVAVAGTAASYDAQQKSAKAQRQANDLQQRQAELTAARNRREAIRAARVAQARSAVVAEGQGAALTSSASGAAGAIVSQTNSNLSFLDQYGNISDQIASTIGKAQKFDAQANTYGAIANLAVSASSFDFGGKPKTTQPTG